MDRLWAPWRMAYILGDEPTEEGCILCNRAACREEKKRREWGILRADEHGFIIQNRYPYNNGHLMVVPVRHVASPMDLADEEYHALGDLIRVSIRAIEKVMQPHGYNIGMNLGLTAGAGIHEHCHYHIVPRWNGDTSFISVLSDTKVISESLLASYDRLLPHM